MRAVCGESFKHRSERAVGKVPKGNLLAAYPAMVQVTRPVEGQNDGQETAATHGDLRVPTIAHLQQSNTCPDGGGSPVADQSPPHPSGCTLSFPFRGPNIWAHHTGAAA